MLRPLEISLTHVKIDERNIQRERNSAFSKLVNIENKDASLNVDSKHFNSIPNQAKNSTMSNRLKEKKRLRNEKDTIERELTNLSLESKKIKYKKDSLQSLIQTKKRHNESIECEKKEELNSELSILQIMQNAHFEIFSHKNSNNNQTLELKNSIQIESHDEKNVQEHPTHIQAVQNETLSENVTNLSSGVITKFDSVLESKTSELEVLHISLPEQESHLKIATSNSGVSVEVKHDGLHEKEKRTLEDAIEEILKNQGVKTKKVKVTS